MSQINNPNGSGGGGGAPTNATYVTLTTSTGLTNERTLAVTSNLSLTDDGAGMPVIIGTGAFTGDITTSANSFATTLASHAVTYAKMQQASTVVLLGNPTGGAANVSEITLGASLAFSGSALNTVQGITTGSTPQFAGIGLGQAAVAGVAMQATGQYNSAENNAGSVTGTATINWNNGNVQYTTLTGNTTFTFSNPTAGGRYLLHIAGAFTPTFPASVRWSGGTTPTATATAGKKDIYTFVYCGVESLYDGAQNSNYATT